MNLLLVRLATLQIMHGTLAWITLAFIKVAAAAENSDYVEDFSIVGVEPRIHGGQLAKEGEFPWQAALLCTRKVYNVKLGPLRNNTFAVEHLTYTGSSYNGYYGATLISNRHLLTAAHTIWDFNSKDRITTITTEVEVKLGTLNANDGDIKFKTNKFIVHPEFDNYHVLWPRRNDIAIIELSTSVSFTKTIYPVLLPVSPLIESENKTAIASGYGRCYANIPTDGILRYVRMRILPNEKCRAIGYPITENQICSEPSASVGMCYGDSGGPLVISTAKQDENNDCTDAYTLLGVTSFGTSGCTGSTVFTRVSSYMSFIRQNMNL